MKGVIFMDYEIKIKMLETKCKMLEKNLALMTKTQGEIIKTLELLSGAVLTNSENMNKLVEALGAD
jgi:hypothetical protein